MKQTTLEKLTAVLKSKKEAVGFFPLDPEYPPLIGTRSPFVQIVRFFVYPLNGLYDQASLRSFMDSLFPGMEPFHRDNFFEFGYGLSFGLFYFDEEVGKLSESRIVLNDPNDPVLKILLDKKCVQIDGKKIERRIIIHLFPDAAIAQRALTDPECRWDMHYSDLYRYKRAAAGIA